MNYDLPEGFFLEKKVNRHFHVRYWVHQHFDAEFKIILPGNLMGRFCRDVEFRQKTIKKYGIAVNFGWPEKNTPAPGVDISKAIVPDNWE
ncbi:hypothetical protein [Pelagibacterium halotolerans]|uniref:hypothetical protein n=1 Tax=Pelagibacterium halotolerans TaxID=531813 RepID=UPI00384C18C8